MIVLSLLSMTVLESPNSSYKRLEHFKAGKRVMKY